MSTSQSSCLIGEETETLVSRGVGGGGLTDGTLGAWLGSPDRKRVTSSWGRLILGLRRVLGSVLCFVNSVLLMTLWGT